LAGVVAVLAVVLVATWIVRVVLTIVLVVGAPVALACYALPQTDGVARLWCRGFAACLGVQAAQSLALVTALRGFFQTDRSHVLTRPWPHRVDVVVAGCLLWLLIRIPVWASRAAFSSRRSTVVRMVKSYVLYRGVSTIARRGA